MTRPTAAKQRMASRLLAGVAFTRAEIPCADGEFNNAWAEAKFQCITSADSMVFIATPASLEWARRIRESNKRQPETPEQLHSRKLKRAARAGLLPKGI